MRRSALYWRRQSQNRPDQPKSPGPEGPCGDVKLLEHIKTILAKSPCHGEGYRQVWARLRYAGIRTSKRRALRLMRANQLLAPNQGGSAPGPQVHDGTITAAPVNDMWDTDMTTAFTAANGQVAMFFAVDHCSLEGVGFHAAESATRFAALEPMGPRGRE